MLRILLIGWICVSLLGCVMSDQVDRLPKETRFQNVQRVVDISGVFMNEGFSHSKEWQPLLSDVFFPGVTFNEPPSEIRISSEVSSLLSCEALSKGKVLALRDLVQEKDFHLVDGGVQIDRKLVGPVLSVEGVGIGTASSVIRMTETGNLVLTSNDRGVGLMLFIVPMAISKSQDAIFQRIEVGEPVTKDKPDSASE